MRRKIAVDVDREDIPLPPASGEPIKPPVFDLPPGDSLNKPAPLTTPKKIEVKKDKKPSGFEAPVSEAVKESLNLLKGIVEQEINLIQQSEEKNNSQIEKLRSELSGLITSISDIQEIAKDIQDMKTPERVQYESDQEYNDSLYYQIISILDSIVSGVEGAFPDYQYEKSTITLFDVAGNIENGEIVIYITLSNLANKTRFHIRVPVYILNRYIQHPDIMYVDGKPFPFTTEAIQKIVGYEIEYPIFYDGAFWADQNKYQNRIDPKIPGVSEQKNYDVFLKKQKIVQPSPRFWTNYGPEESHPNLNYMSSSPVYTNPSEYSLM